MSTLLSLLLISFPCKWSCFEDLKTENEKAVNYCGHEDFNDFIIFYVKFCTFQVIRFFNIFKLQNNNLIFLADNRENK
mgnify:CR=1 FL=1